MYVHVLFIGLKVGSTLIVKPNGHANFLCHLEKTSRLVATNSHHKFIGGLDSFSLIWLHLRWVVSCLHQQINPIFVHLVNLDSCSLVVLNRSLLLQCVSVLIPKLPIFMLFSMATLFSFFDDRQVVIYLSLSPVNYWLLP